MDVDCYYHYDTLYVVNVQSLLQTNMNFQFLAPEFTILHIIAKKFQQYIFTVIVGGLNMALCRVKLTEKSNSLLNRCRCLSEWPEDNGFNVEVIVRKVLRTRWYFCTYTNSTVLHNNGTSNFYLLYCYNMTVNESQI